MPGQQRGVERIIAFSDGVVAIAITLLVLPLTDIRPADYGDDVVALLRANEPALGAFLISFVVVARYWLSHHRVFSRVCRPDPGLVRLNLLWLFAIVFLPFPTALVQQSQQVGMVEFYMACLLVTSLVTRWLAAYVDARPALVDAPPGEVEHQARLSAWIGIAVLCAAMVVTPIAPDWGVRSLYLLFLVAPLVHLLRRRPGRTAHESAAGRAPTP